MLALLLLASCGSERVEYPPALNSLLHDFAPELTLGDRVADPAQALELECSPYLGYSDRDFSTPDGLRELWVQVDRPSDDGCPPRYAHIESVAFGVPSLEVADAVESHITNTLGFPPAEECRVVRAEFPFHFRVWPVEGHGVLIRTPLDSVDFERGNPELIFGPAFALNQLGQYERVPCP